VHHSNEKSAIQKLRGDGEIGVMATSEILRQNDRRATDDPEVLLRILLLAR
jgi:hypothetical protein